VTRDQEFPFHHFFRQKVWVKFIINVRAESRGQNSVKFSLIKSTLEKGAEGMVELENIKQQKASWQCIKTKDRRQNEVILTLVKLILKVQDYLLYHTFVLYYSYLITRKK